MANAVLEILAAEMRVFAKDDARPPEPFDIGFSLVRVGEHRMEIKGLDKPIKPSDWAAIGAELSKYDITEVLIIRNRPDGTREERVVSVAKAARSQQRKTKSQ